MVWRNRAADCSAALTIHRQLVGPPWAHNRRSVSERRHHRALVSLFCLAMGCGLGARLGTYTQNSTLWRASTLVRHTQHNVRSLFTYSKQFRHIMHWECTQMLCRFVHRLLMTNVLRSRSQEGGSLPEMHPLPAQVGEHAPHDKHCAVQSTTKTEGNINRHHLTCTHTPRNAAFAWCSG